MRPVRLTLKLISIALAAHLLTSGLARAGFSDAEYCFARSGSFRIDIDVCTRALGDLDRSPATRSTLFLRRGEAFIAARAYKLAHQDFSEALRLNPASSKAFELRGGAYTKSGNYVDAIKSYRNAIKLNLHSAVAYRGLGLAQLMAVRPVDAAESLTQSLQQLPRWPETMALRAIAQFGAGEFAAAESEIIAAINEAYPYPLGYLWAYFAARFRDADGQQYLDAVRRETEPDAWPGPLIEAIARDSGNTDALLNASDRRPVRQERRRLQAAFFLGVKALLDGDKPGARALLIQTQSPVHNFDLVEVPIARLFLRERL